MYYINGHALLRVVEMKTDALGGAAAGAADDEGDDDGEEDGAAAGAAAAAAAAADEDLEALAEADEHDDADIAFENLDVARVIYSKMSPPTPVSAAAAGGGGRRWRRLKPATAHRCVACGHPNRARRRACRLLLQPPRLSQHHHPSPPAPAPLPCPAPAALLCGALQSTEIALGKVHMRLGDVKMESESFALALDEYKAAFSCFTRHMPPHDRCVARARPRARARLGSARRTERPLPLPPQLPSLPEAAPDAPAVGFEAGGGAERLLRVSAELAALPSLAVHWESSILLAQMDGDSVLRVAITGPAGAWLPAGGLPSRRARRRCS
jgi:hypothetical protein